MLPTGLRELLPVLAGILALGLILAAFARQARPGEACECRRPGPDFLRRSSALR